jgi:uncharacterized protein
MIGKLTETQIDDLLRKEIVGRIGCHTPEMVYVVPISYVYDGKNIYCHTYEGLKVEMMRKNPNVCFEVDDISNMGNWQSVIAWGKFEEINKSDERNSALRLLLNRALPIISSITTHLGKNWPFYPDEINNSIDGIVFRIVLDKRTGNFETNTTSPAVSG